MRVLMIGRRSGAERPVILGYFEDGDDLVTMAMNGWADPEPARWLNLQAQPDVTVELKGATRAVHARAAGAEERPRLWRAGPSTTRGPMPLPRTVSRDRGGDPRAARGRLTLSSPNRPDPTVLRRRSASRRRQAVPGDHVGQPVGLRKGQPVLVGERSDLIGIRPAHGRELWSDRRRTARTRRA